MTDAAPKRIWACPMRDGGGFGPGDEDDPPIWAEGYWDQVQDGSKDENEYILASEHAALIREAEARGMERAAFIAWDAEDETVNRTWEHWGEHRNMVTAQTVQKEIAAAIRAEAAALRGEKEPK